MEICPEQHQKNALSAQLQKIGANKVPLRGWHLKAQMFSWD